MLSYLSTGMFLLVGLINAYPLVGITGTSSLNRLYGIDIIDPNLLLLMRHRAVLFGIVGGLLLYASFYSEHRTLATITGLVSMLSFVVLMFTGDTFNAQLWRIFWADVIASVLLVIGYLAFRYTQPT
ncbi:MAG: phosphopantetheine adenylyltransferase [Chloroflexota bacterium]